MGDQVGAEPERLKEAMNKFELVHVEMEPGDVLFFDCNLLHARYTIKGLNNFFNAALKNSGYNLCHVNPDTF